MCQTIINAIAGAVSRKGAEKSLRILTSKEEVKQALAERKQLYIVKGVKGLILTWYEVRQNGALKEWKTRPNDWELPIKYGLYDAWRMKHTNSLTFGEYVLAVEAEE